MADVLQNTRHKRSFLMVDVNDHRTGLEGLSVDIYIRKQGQLAFTLRTGTITDVGFGVYEYEYTADETNVLGDLNVHCEAVGADDTDFTDQVISVTTIRLPTGNVDVTPSNVYVGLAESNAFFATKINHVPWDEASDDAKTRALYEATRLIDRLNYSGQKNDAEQVLEFPRNGDTTIPIDIKNACCEIAFALVDGVDVEIEAQNLTQDQVGFGMARTRHDRSWVLEAMAHNIPSVVAWSYLKPYLRDRSELKFIRVN